MYAPTRGIISAPTISVDEARATIDTMRFDPVGGHWTRSFRPTPDIQQWTKEIFAEFMSENGIFSLRAPGMKQLEGDIIGWALDLMNGPVAASGNITTGGSESIYSAIHAARNWAREQRPDATNPTVLVPATAHPAFSKACEYLDLNIRRVPVGPDRRADLDAMRAAIDEDVICLVGSAPCWPFAVMDPIAPLAEMAAERGLWMHVDACVGGYLLPFMEALGEDVPIWDFRLPAVRSISADLHKFGYAPKPCSSVLWSDSDLLRFHLVEVADGPSGPYQTTAMAGSRNEGAAFTAWALIRHLGFDGYTELARTVMTVKRELLDGIAEISGLDVPEQDFFPSTFGATDGSLPAIQAGMAARGWMLMGVPDPPLIVLPIDPAAEGQVADKFLQDLREVAKAKDDGKLRTEGELRYG